MSDDIRKSVVETAAVLGRCAALFSLRAVLRFLGVVVLVLVAAVIADFSGIKSWWISADLSEYAQVIRHTDCPLEAKEQLLDRTEALEDYLRHGGSIGFARWQTCNRAVRDLLKLGLAGDNITLLQRELRRVERELAEQQTGEPLR